MFIIPLLIYTVLNIHKLEDRGLQINFYGNEIVVENLRFPGATSFALPGEPNLPALNLFVGIPQDGDVDVRIIEHRTETFYGIDVEPVKPLAIYESPGPEKVEHKSEVYKKDRLFPEDIIEVSQPGYFRNINTVNIKINPVRYNPLKKELVISRVLKISVNFKGEPRSTPIVEDNFEEIYKRTIINYEQCKNWRRERIQQTIKNPFSIGVWYKIEVDREGLFKIGYEDLKKAGINPKQFDPKTIKIYTAAFELLPKNVMQEFPDSLVEIPVFVEGEDDHSFDKQDYLVFYCFPANHFIPDTSLNWYENGYAEKNIYWFTFGGSYGKRMERVNAAWNNSPPDTLVTEILHIEKDVHNPTRSGINWYWMDFSLGTAESTVVRLPIKHIRARGNALATISIFSMSSSLQQFWYRFYMNDVNFFNDTLILPQAMSLPANRLMGQGMLNGDSSIFEFKVKRVSPDTTRLTIYLNCFDIEYKRLTDMSLPFHAYFKNPGDYTIKCSNVNSPPFIIDITDLRQPRMFDNYTLSGNNIIFSSRCDSFQLLYCVQLSSAMSAPLIPADPGHLRTVDNGCEYLFITHRNFYNSIMSLVNYRRQEYTTKVVTIDAIFDDFSFGKYDPLAIKHFLKHAYDNWTTVPKYVLIVGDATYDYKNNLEKDNPPNYVPMYEAGTILSGNPGIPPNYIYEGEYVNFFGTEAMVLGRITVRNNQEVRDFIDKLIAYENGDIDGNWNKRIILSADDEYANGWGEGISHASACEAISYAVSDTLYDRAKIYMLSYLPFPPHDEKTTKPLATEDFIKEINKGALIGCFFGHGNTYQLAHEKLFMETDIPKVNNGKRFFFFYFASCTVGRFDDSDHECLAEELVRMKQGAIGTMGAHAGSNTYINEPIGIELYRLFTNPDTNLTMGECYHIAKHRYGGIPIYLMLGDPATKIRKVNGNFNLQAIPDSVRPLEKLKVLSDKKPYYLVAYLKDTTHIKWIDATTANKICGHIRRAVCRSGDPSDTIIFDYRVEGKEIYQGYWSIDTARLNVPIISTTHLPSIKLSGYKDRTGAIRDSIRVYGTLIPTTDQEGPKVSFFDGARELKDGDWVDKNFTLTGVVSDESGINLLNSREDARGFFLYVGNDNVINRLDLRDKFIYNQNSYSEGEFKAEIILENPQESLTVYVSDNCFNQTIKKIILNTNIYDRISIEDILIYPNPLKTHKGLWITFVLSQSAKVNIKIYTIAGRLVKVISEIPCHPGYNQWFWDGRDEYGDELSNGVYFVHILAEGSSGTDKKIEKFIIAR